MEQPEEVHMNGDDSSAAPIELLPDALVALVLEELGLELALSARTVCRQWRAAAASIEWRRISFAAGGPPRLRSITALVSGGGPPLRLAAVESFRLDLSSAKKPPAIDEALAAAVPLAAAVAAASACLLEVHFDFGLAILSSVGSVVAMIAALSPRGSTLRTLSMRGVTAAKERAREALNVFPVAAPASELGAALGAFSALEHLSLPLFVSLDAAAVAAVARALPNIRAMNLTIDALDAAAGLAPLPALASLCLRVRLDRPDHGIAALAASPAGLSLRQLAFECPAVLRGPDLRALASLPRLERLEGDMIVPGEVLPADLEALRGSRRLRVLRGLVVPSPTPPRLDALARALAGMPCLEELDLRIDLSGYNADEADVSGYREDGGTAPRPALCRLLARAAPLLRRLDVVSGPGPAPCALPVELEAALRPVPPRLERLHYDVLLTQGGVGASPRLGPLAAFGPRLQLTARLLPCGGDAAERAAGASLRSSLARLLPEARIAVVPFIQRRAW